MSPDLALTVAGPDDPRWPAVAGLLRESFAYMAEVLGLQQSKELRTIDKLGLEKVVADLRARGEIIPMDPLHEFRAGEILEIQVFSGRDAPRHQQRTHRSVGQESVDGAHRGAVPQARCDAEAAGGGRPHDARQSRDRHRQDDRALARRAHKAGLSDRIGDASA